MLTFTLSVALDVIIKGSQGLNLSSFSLLCIHDRSERIFLSIIKGPRLPSCFINHCPIVRERSTAPSSEASPACSNNNRIQQTPQSIPQCQIKPHSIHNTSTQPYHPTQPPTPNKPGPTTSNPKTKPTTSQPPPH